MSLIVVVWTAFSIYTKMPFLPVNVLLVVGNERLQVEMSKLMNTNKTVTVIRVPKNSGVRAALLESKERVLTHLDVWIGQWFGQRRQETLTSRSDPFLLLRRSVCLFWCFGATQHVNSFPSLVYQPSRRRRVCSTICTAHRSYSKYKRYATCQPRSYGIKWRNNE